MWIVVAMIIIVVYIISYGSGYHDGQSIRRGGTRGENGKGIESRMWNMPVTSAL